RNRCGNNRRVIRWRRVLRIPSPAHRHPPHTWNWMHLFSRDYRRLGAGHDAWRCGGARAAIRSRGDPDRSRAGPRLGTAQPSRIFRRNGCMKFQELLIEAIRRSEIPLRFEPGAEEAVAKPVTEVLEAWISAHVPADSESESDAGARALAVQLLAELD